MNTLALEVEAALGLVLLDARRSANSRSRSTRNSRPSKTWCTSSRSHGWRSRSSTDSGSSRSSTSRLSRRLRSTPSRCSRRLSPALPLISSTWATTPARSPYWPSHFAAVFGPTPGHAGQVVAGLADQRGEVAVALGRHAVLLGDRGGVHPPDLGHPAHRVEQGHLVVDELEGVAVAGADDHLEALRRRPAWLRVAMTSSASKPSTSTCRMRSASSTSRSSGSWPENSVGVAERPALYSGYSAGPEGLARHVEGHPDVGRRLVAQHVDQHRGEAVDGIRVLAGARREVLDREGEEGPVGQRVSVEEEELHAWQPSHHDRHAPTPPTRTAGDRPDLMAAAAALRAMNPDSLMDRMGIEVLEASPERLVATMPVEGNTQPYGLLHGGASVVLAETLGSIGAALHAGPGQGRRRPRHQRHPPPGGALGPRHRHRHADQPGPHAGLLRGRRHRRRRPAHLHEPDHLPDPGCRAGRLRAPEAR